MTSDKNNSIQDAAMESLTMFISEEMSEATIKVLKLMAEEA